MPVEVEKDVLLLQLWKHSLDHRFRGVTLRSLWPRLLCVRRQYETARTRLALLDELLGAAKESRQNGWLLSIHAASCLRFCRGQAQPLRSIRALI